MHRDRLIVLKFGSSVLRGRLAARHARNLSLADLEELLAAEAGSQTIAAVAVVGVREAVAS